MTTKVNRNAKTRPMNGAATMNTTIWTSPFRRSRARTTEGIRPANSPARTIAPPLTDCFLAMARARTEATPARKAIVVSSKNRAVPSALGSSTAPIPPAAIVEPTSPPMRA